VRHLLEKHQRLRPEKRVQLVQSLLRGDFNNAQLILQETKRFSIITLVTSPVSAFLPSSSDGEPLKREMKSLAARLSDSKFLLDLYGVHDEVLRPIVRDIESLSHSLLLSLIDATVDAMARAVVAMQQEVFRKSLQHEIKSEVMKLRNEALRELIRKLNAKSVGPRDSYVLSELIKCE
jgi:hypothetical protein